MTPRTHRHVLLYVSLLQIALFSATLWVWLPDGKHPRQQSAEVSR